jgi:hypothetical protein
MDSEQALDAAKPQAATKPKKTAVPKAGSLLLHFLSYCLMLSTEVYREQGQERSRQEAQIS